MSSNSFEFNVTLPMVDASLPNSKDVVARRLQILHITAPSLDGPPPSQEVVHDEQYGVLPGVDVPELEIGGFVVSGDITVVAVVVSFIDDAGNESESSVARFEPKDTMPPEKPGVPIVTIVREIIENSSTEEPDTSASAE